MERRKDERTNLYERSIQAKEETSQLIIKICHCEEGLRTFIAGEEPNQEPRLNILDIANIWTVYLMIIIFVEGILYLL